MIYLDHNATTPLHPRVFASMVPFLQEQWGNPSSPYRFAKKVREAVERARRTVADGIGCTPDEIIFCPSGTASDNLAIRGVACALRPRGRHIVTSVIEHPAILNTCKALENEGFRLTCVPVNRNGVVELDVLDRCMDKETILVTIMHANNETGVVQPIEQIAEMTRARGILLHTDAVQTAGKLPLPIGERGVDLLTFTGHKIYGPKGAAALYVREGTPLSSITTGGAQERGLNAGTENVAGIMGLAEALMLAVESSSDEGVRLRRLRDRLENEIRTALVGVKINGAGSQRVPNTSSMSFHGIDGESIVLGMDLRDICVSTGSACSTGDPEPSHVLLAMGCSSREAQGSIRISLGRDTNDEQLRNAVRALVETVGQLRAISSVPAEG